MARIGAVAAGLAFAVLCAPAWSGPYKAPRTTGGVPDLQGDWTNVSLTRLYRRDEFKTLVVTPAQAAAFEAGRAAMQAAHNAPVAPTAGAPAVAEDDDLGDAEWRVFGRLARIRGQIRSSWIVEPADGQLPYSAAGKAAVDAQEDADNNHFANPEDRPSDERCLTSIAATAGPPLLNHTYNSEFQIVQTPGEIVILAEMNHDARIIHMRDRRHLPEAIRPWMGDSVGWWEGDTLVVETTNLNPGERARYNGNFHLMISPKARIVERFTRISASQILYAFSVADPVNYTTVWRGEMPLNAAATPIYEFACHEGNYALANVLAGARRAERAAGK